MPIKTPEVPRAHWEKICDRWQAGDTMTSIARDHGVGAQKIKKILSELNALDRVKEQPKKLPIRPGNGTDLKEFTKTARSILWRQDTGGDHPAFEKWQNRIAELASDNGGGLAKGQAIVRASKDFKCLHRLFREHDVSGYDPHPKSHPDIEHWGKTNKVKNAEEVVVYGWEAFDYRGNLRWAMEAAGAYLQTHKHPVSAPNGTAWFFYRQAIDEPKDFMTKFGQMEQKAGDGGESDLRKETRRSIDEIHEQLEQLEEVENETDCQIEVRQETSQEEEGAEV